MKESDGIMLFHDCSSQLYWWLKKQRHVKEESLTDWLLYQVSEKCPDIYYQAFTKHEEAEPFSGTGQKALSLYQG